MIEHLVLCWGTVGACGFAERLRAAQAGGFTAISVSPELYHQAVSDDGFALADLAPALADHGLAVAELDPYLVWANDITAVTAGTPAVRAAEEELYEMARILETRYLTVAFPQAGGVAIELIADAFAAIADRAAEHRLRVQVEFLPFSDVPNLAAAANVAGTVARHDAGIVFDTWHHARSGTPDDAIDRYGSLVSSIQVSDAPREPCADLVNETLHARRLPGDGDIDLVSMLSRLRALGSTAPLGAEVFSDQLHALAPLDAAQLAGDALRRIAVAAADTPVAHEGGRS